jgi:hypothetical protein
MIFLPQTQAAKVEFKIYAGKGFDTIEAAIAADLD